jgi:hypothetical protein
MTHSLSSEQNFGLWEVDQKSSQTWQLIDNSHMLAVDPKLYININNFSSILAV